MSTAVEPGRHSATSSPGAASRRSTRSNRVGRIATPYLLLAPALVMYAVFTVYPIYRQFDISFFNWHIFPGASNPFVGWSNYTAIFSDPVVRTASFNSFLFIVITVPIQMALGLFAAAVLTDRLPGSMFWRAAVYVPVVTSWVVVSWVFSYIFASQGGIMNAVVGFFAGHSVSITGPPRPGPRTGSSGFSASGRVSAGRSSSSWRRSTASPASCSSQPARTAPQSLASGAT